jgi:SAM-dependent methyltransferase
MEDKHHERTFSFEQHKSTFIDKLAAKVRYNKIDSILNSLQLDLRDKRICDVGCGYNCNFLLHMKDKYQTYSLYGVDVSINPALKNVVHFSEIDLKKEDFKIADNSIDIVTSLAVIEHLSDPAKYLSEIYRILTKGGYFILTTPPRLAKPILYFLAYTGIGTKEEILDHKLYYSKKLLFHTLRDKFTEIKIRYFSLGINMYLTCKKK